MPGVSHTFIIALLLVGGFFRSLQFTSMNSLAYADLGAKSTSQATNFTSVAQQLSISAGVTVAALALESLRYSRGQRGGSRGGGGDRPVDLGRALINRG